ncbi:VWA domain-containing protein [Aliikangiella maris]|uniref:VWA domain-containing protein n=2 Tax=Aliikangiella maris TaxID=3162458 RepID=A0ABV3MKK5_9GAMM
MQIDLTQFHFIRPEWLYLLIPAIILIVSARHLSKQRSNWQKIISPHLLQYLAVGSHQQKLRHHFWLTSLIAIVTIIAISGPSFRQVPVPIFQNELARVILLDLSLSMDATDIKPSRLERAKFKLMDLLEKSDEGTVGLIVYAGDAFVISPLTSDAKTIANMVPTLSTGIMPVLGSRPDLAIEKSIELLQNAKHNRGQIIWLTDGVESSQVNPIIKLVNQSDYSLSILAIGTDQGAPIPLPDKSGFLKDASGKIVVPMLQLGELNEIAQNTQAGIIKMTADEQDIAYLNKAHEWHTQANEAEQDNEQLINRWVDDGYWLIWLVIIGFIFKLLRQPVNQGSALMPLFAAVLLSSVFAKPAHALEWRDLWKTKDQQAQQAYREGDYGQAAQLFKNKQWQATSQYKNGDYSNAAGNFDPALSNESLYNHATSLAKANRLQEALDAYDQLLANNPDHEDGKYNRDIVEQLLKQQQNEQQSNQNSDQEDQDQNQQQDEQDAESNSNSDQQENNAEQQDQQQGEQQEQESAEDEQSQAQQQAEVSQDERSKSEKDQALEHWLEKIPDDPGGLLRRKMYREYQKRGRQQKEEKLW